MTNERQKRDDEMDAQIDSALKGLEAKGLPETRRDDLDEEQRDGESFEQMAERRLDAVERRLDNAGVPPGGRQRMGVLG